MSKMWSGRFREPLDPVFEEWQRSFPFDWKLLPQEVAASIAHATALERAEILSAEELKSIVAGLSRVCERFTAASASVTEAAALVASNPSVEDIHHFVELSLSDEIGDVALKLHAGRSRNEQIATDMRLYVRDAIDANVSGLSAWIDSLLMLCEESRAGTMPAYTHLQRAEPVLVTHWLLAYVEMIRRDISRLQDCRRRLNVCPLGSGAVAGATLALDRNVAATLLQFDGPTANSMDATSDRDFLIEYVGVLSLFGIHVSRFAEEITLFATSEFGFVILPETFSTGSSAMPQKKNPDLTELLRGKSARLIGAQVALNTLLKGLPLAYNKDLQEGQEIVFSASETVAGILSVLPRFTKLLRFNLERMAEASSSGYLNAMAGATYLSKKGVPFRKAHEQIGNAVRLGLETKRELGELSLVELSQFGDAFDEGFYGAISTASTLDCHDVEGGTARGQVDQALMARRRELQGQER